MKNMLLVMSTAGVFEHDDPSLQVAAHIALPPHQRPGSAERHYSALWQVTWERIDCFLPNLKQDLLATKSPWHSRAASPPVATAPEPQTMETEGRPLSDDESTKAGSTSGIYNIFTDNMSKGEHQISINSWK